MEKRGIPVATVCTDDFFALGKAESEILGIPALPIAHIPHPMAGQPLEHVTKVAEQAVDEIVHILTADAKELEKSYKDKSVAPRKKLRHKALFADEFGTTDTADTFKAPDSFEAANRLLYHRGWTDGLPVTLPTGERFDKMIRSSNWDPKTLIGLVPPKSGEATVQKIAVNAIMAGCDPEFLPVVIAATKAMLEQPFNLSALQTTTHQCTVLVLINGPLADELEISYGCNAMGQGFMSNATIGRSIRLILTNIGGASPGVLDRATLGSPAKYSFCFAENEAENPWEPLHVERGFPKSHSTVTVVGSEGPHNVNDHGSRSGEEILTTISGVLATPGANNFYMGGEPLIVLGPEHAAAIARQGFSKQDVKQWLFENARVPMRLISPGNLDRFIKIYPKRFSGLGSKDRVPMVDSPEELMVVVAGGPGRQSAIIPTFGATKAVTVPIADPEGKPILVNSDGEGH